MFGKLGDMGGMLKKVQELQQNMEKMHEELARTEVTGKSDCGRVEAVVACDMTVSQIVIKKECAETGDPEIIAPLVLEAVNKALEEAKLKTKERMSEVTGGLNIPGLTC